MGILNVTPDSFHELSRVSQERIIEKAAQMLDAGADILDIGGYSTRPNAENISEEIELERVLPALEAIKTAFPKAILSIDTWRGTVAETALRAGCKIVNDVSAWQLDESLYEVLCKYRPAYVLMHMRGTPSTMSNFTNYQDVTGEVLKFLSEKIYMLHRQGIYDIAVDPGIGFAKTTEQNFTLVRELKRFHILEKPILVGLSRKSFIYKTLGVQAEGALNGSTAMHMAALLNGAKILRVHDVREARECVMLWEQLSNNV